MASKQSTVDYIVDQMASAGTITSKKMFGEYGVYLDGKIFALVADDLLYVKPTAAGRALIGSPTEAPPYPGAKNYFLISGDRWDDAEFLCELVQVTARELPAPKPPKVATPKAAKSTGTKVAKSSPTQSAPR